MGTAVPWTFRTKIRAKSLFLDKINCYDSKDDFKNQLSGKYLGTRRLPGTLKANQKVAIHDNDIFTWDLRST